MVEWKLELGSTGMLLAPVETTITRLYCHLGGEPVDKFHAINHYFYISLVDTRVSGKRNGNII